MLTEFSVTGFKNFKDKLTFTLDKPGKYDFKTELVQNGVLNKGIIYGKNGAGKSNLGEALFDIYNNLMAFSDNPNFTSPFFGIYKNTQNTVDPRFEYHFQFGSDNVIYEYTKANPIFVSSEKLIINGSEVFSYSYKKRDSILCKIPNTEHLNFGSMADGISPLLFIYRTTKFADDSPISKLFSFVKGMLWFRCLNRGNEYRGYKSSAEFVEAAIIKNNKVKEYQDFLNDFADFNFALSVVETNNIDPLTGKKMKSLGAVYGSKTYPLLNLLSTGTEALELFFYWKMSFPEIKFLFVDEFDAFYHFELSAKIISLLNNETSFQSFVTTHNTYLMSNELMRPDALFIISNGQIKSLPECTERELREGHNLEKIYRNDGFEGHTGGKDTVID